MSQELTEAQLHILVWMYRSLFGVNQDYDANKLADLEGLVMDAPQDIEALREAGYIDNYTFEVQEGSAWVRETSPNVFVLTRAGYERGKEAHPES